MGKEVKSEIYKLIDCIEDENILQIVMENVASYTHPKKVTDEPIKEQLIKLDEANIEKGQKKLRKDFRSKIISGLRKYLITLILICSTIFLFLLFLYFYRFSDGLSKKSYEWGDFGSYVGGIIGTMLSGINLLILIVLTYKTKEEQNHEWITSIRIGKYHELINSLKSNPQQFFKDKDLDDDFFLFDENYTSLMKIQKSLRAKYTIELKNELLVFLKSIIKSQNAITEEINKKYNPLKKRGK